MSAGPQSDKPPPRRFPDGFTHDRDNAVVLVACQARGCNATAQVELGGAVTLATAIDHLRNVAGWIVAPIRAADPINGGAPGMVCGGCASDARRRAAFETETKRLGKWIAGRQAARDRDRARSESFRRANPERRP